MASCSNRHTPHSRRLRQDGVKIASEAAQPMRREAIIRPASRPRSVRDGRAGARQLTLFPEAVTLTRIQPVLNEWRYYQIEIQVDLFGTIILVRRWGRIGYTCRTRLDPHRDFGSALDALATLARRKRQRGYQDQQPV
ncbi:hypothetical protein ACOSOMT5_P2928 [Acidiphilium sp. MT5]